jgi:hypothetical protein
LSYQTFHRWRGLSANAPPVRQAVLRNTDAFFCGRGDRVIKTDALDEASIATGTLVGNNNIEKRASLSTATGESNNDHGISFG